MRRSWAGELPRCRSSHRDPALEWGTALSAALQQLAEAIATDVALARFVGKAH